MRVATSERLTPTDMPINVSASAPAWVQVRATREHASPFADAVTMIGLCEVPGIKLSVEGPPEAPTSVRLELPNNALDLPLWLELANTFEVPSRPTGRGDLARVVIPDELLDLPLYRHQREAVQWLADLRGGGILADQMGLGKTRSAAVGARVVTRGQPGPVLIVGPKFTRDVWRRELATLGFTERAGSWVQLGTLGGGLPAPELRAQLKTADWWFAHYEIVHQWQGVWVTGLLPKPKVVILDEAHWARNVASRRGRAAHGCVPSIPNRFLLTGTPVASHPRELWSLLTLAHGPQTWGSPSAFRKRYCGAIDEGYGLVDQEPTNVEELQLRMGRSYLRRTLDDAGIELPPLTRTQVEVANRSPAVFELSAQQLSAILTALERSTYGDDTLEQMMRLSRLTSLAKREATAEYVNELVVQGETAVVFTQERATAERLSNDVEGSCYIHGGMGQDERDRLVADFQAGHGTALFATYGALREGVTLTRSRYVVLHDLSWVPSDVLQAEARVYRIGQSRPVTSVWMTLSRSFDTLLAAHLARKAEAIASSINDFAASQALTGAGLSRMGSIELAAEKLLETWKVWDGEVAEDEEGADV